MSPFQSVMILAVAHVAQPAPHTGNDDVDALLVDRERAVYRLGTATTDREFWGAHWRRVSAEDRLAELLDVQAPPREPFIVDDGFGDWDPFGLNPA